jgi:cyclic pyranopterin phosphate synthase
VSVDFTLAEDGVIATATASLTAKTGVEMEAMTAGVGRAADGL